MKIQSSIRSILVVLPLVAASAAFGEAPKPNQIKFWQQVGHLVQRCSAQTYTIEDGKKVDGPLHSTCDELEVRGSQARFFLNGEWYIATLVESDDSDGGDLDDIYVQDKKGATVAERHNIPAFGDVLLGLAGGQVQLQTQDVQDPNIAQ